MADERMHTHKGYVRSDTGKERAHPVSTNHKDSEAAKWHKVEVMNFGRNKTTKKVEVVKKAPAKEQLQKEFKGATVKLTKSVVVPLDEEGYLYVDLTQKDMQYEGVRVKFQRTENRHRKTIGLQIERD